MTPSLRPGGKPSVNSRLLSFLEQGNDQISHNYPVHLTEDEFDRLIHRESLRTARFVWVRELDLALFVLTNRRVITQPLSAYNSLTVASDEHLAAYTSSESDIHWPELDVDLSLRGLLMNEVVKAVTLA